MIQIDHQSGFTKSQSQPKEYGLTAYIIQVVFLV